MTPRKPSIVVANTDGTALVVRSIIQQGLGAFLVQGIMLFNLLTLSADQALWLGGLFSLVICGIQNFWETIRVRKFIGARVRRP